MFLLVASYGEILKIFCLTKVLDAIRRYLYVFLVIMITYQRAQQTQLAGATRL
jgi:hypothetical protein